MTFTSKAMVSECDQIDLALRSTSIGFKNVIRHPMKLCLQMLWGIHVDHHGWCGRVIVQLGQTLTLIKKEEWDRDGGERTLFIV